MIESGKFRPVELMKSHEVVLRLLVGMMRHAGRVGYSGYVLSHIQGGVDHSRRELGLIAAEKNFEEWATGTRCLGLQLGRKIREQKP